jgi:hypothetical protein
MGWPAVNPLAAAFHHEKEEEEKWVQIHGRPPFYPSLMIHASRHCVKKPQRAYIIITLGDQPSALTHTDVISFHFLSLIQSRLIFFSPKPFFFLSF